MERKLDPGRIAIYTRLSKTGGIGQDAGWQEEICRQYGEERFGLNSAGFHLYADTAGARRPEFDRLMAHVRGEWVDSIVCWSLDRICRSVNEFSGLMEELRKYHVALLTIQEHFDTSSPLGAMALYTAGLLTKLERESSGERVRDTMQELARSGRWLGGVTPTGYRSEAAEGKKGEKKAFRLMVVPQEARLIQDIYSCFLETHSLTKTETHLNENGKKTKNGRNFSRFTVRQILENPVYAVADADTYAYFSKAGAELCSDAAAFDGTHGIMAYNKTAQKANHANQVRDIAEWIVAVGAHEGLIGGADWVRAQEVLNRNKDPEFRKPRSDHALLPGILYCGLCGAHMRPKLTQRRNAQGELAYSYLCERKEKTLGAECDVRNVSGNRLDAAVVGQLRQMSDEEIPLLRRADELKKGMAAGGGRFRRLREECAEELAGKEKTLSELVFSLAKMVDKNAYAYMLEQIDGLRAETTRLKERIAELDDALSEHPLLPAKAQMLRELRESLRRGFDTLGVEQKRTALRVFVERVEWDGQNMYIYLNGDTP